MCVSVCAYLRVWMSSYGLTCPHMYLYNRVKLSLFFTHTHTHIYICIYIYFLGLMSGKWKLGIIMHTHTCKTHIYGDVCVCARLNMDKHVHICTYIIVYNSLSLSLTHTCIYIYVCIYIYIYPWHYVGEMKNWKLGIKGLSPQTISAMQGWVYCSAVEAPKKRNAMGDNHFLDQPHMRFDLCVALYYKLVLCHILAWWKVS